MSSGLADNVIAMSTNDEIQKAVESILPLTNDKEMETQTNSKRKFEQLHSEIEISNSSDLTSQNTESLPPVKQCYRCFAYGHVANSPCRNNRLCRDCGEQYHSTSHCFGSHSSNSNVCPEYTRQKHIKERMSLMKEDYFTASLFYPITYKRIKGTLRRPQTFSEAARSFDSTNLTEYPDLPETTLRSNLTPLSNRFSPLSSVTEPSSITSPQTSSTYRKPSSHSYTKHIKTVQHTQTGTRPNRSTIHQSKTRTINPEPKNNPPVVTQDDREHYKTLLNDKVNEIRNKLKNTNVTSKKQMDDFLATFICADSNSKNISIQIRVI
ncbi:hypothetical protein J6590_017505 [Homalodisca vitripennis]|nr:hypothetical protein J6590_017505 [Homalodisca vitripennis]